MPIAQMPKVMKDAVLAIEDARFYQHGGVDYMGVLRAGLANLSEARSQGASTITMQVARNFYLSTEKTFTRKIYEILLALKIESQLSKDQILELYMNQIYLGQRAYGFAAASEIYFGKPLKDITSPRRRCWPACRRRRRPTTRSSTRARATARQHYIIDRMLENGFITRRAARGSASRRSCSYRAPTGSRGARRVRRRDGAPADVRAVRRRRLHARPERLPDASTRPSRRSPTAPCARASSTTSGARSTAAPKTMSTCRPTRPSSTRASPRRWPSTPTTTNCGRRGARGLAAKVVAVLQNGEPLDVTGDGLQAGGLGPGAARRTRRRRSGRGAVVRADPQTPRATGRITQLPEVEGAFVALDPRTGAIRAMVGGFDFARASSTTSRRPGASRARASSRSSTRPRWKRASRRRR